MLRVERSTIIGQPIETVFAYVADFDNFTAWSTGVVSAELITNGPTGVGTKARIVRRAIGQEFEMDFELVDYEPNRAIGFRGMMLGIPFSTRLDFVALDGVDGIHGLTTRVTQSGQVSVPAVFFLMEPVVRQVLTTTFEDDLRKLKRLLESDSPG